MGLFRRSEHDLVELLACVLDAADGIAPWELPQSVLGRLRRALPPESSEYLMFASRDVVRSARYATNVLIPSLQRHGPSWVPAALRDLFFHQTTIQRHPDANGDYDGFPGEEWFFINGILTDSGMAAWNAKCLARLFGRPITVIQNATDGPIVDLLECAGEKAFGMNGEAADVAFPEIYRALKSADAERIVVIAHSQGTLIASVVVRLLRLVYERAGELMSETQRREELDHLRSAGVTIDPEDFDAVSRDELRRLEIYCFANCATRMRYVDPGAQLPWIESLGNEHDLVARLGMLAPHRDAEEIEIDGPLWIRRGAWGHLLNHHYLMPIERAQRGAQHSSTASATSEPFEPFDDVTADAPRLFGYIDGATQEPAAGSPR